MTAVLFLIVSSLASECSDPETARGYWSGSMAMGGRIVDMAVDLSPDDPRFSSHDLMLVEQPVSDLSIDDGEIRFTLALDVDLVFVGTLSGSRIDGTVTIRDQSPSPDIVFSLTERAGSPAKPYTVEELTVNGAGVALSAELYSPLSAGPHPALVLVHGSSANLKEEYRFHADLFGRLGFQVLIFDKRGNGGSTGDYSTSSHDDLVGDAVACLEALRARKDVDSSRIGLWGLSQGAMLLPRIAARTEIPAFLIAVSPEVTSTAEAAAFSDSLRLVRLGRSESDGQTAAASHRTVERMIREGSSHAEVETFIRRNAQQNPFMNQTGLYGGIEIDRGAFDGFYWRGRAERLGSYWKNVQRPTLVLFGGRDRFVDPSRNAGLLQSFGNPRIEIRVFPLANHVLKKSLSPALDGRFDFPRLIEGYRDQVERWLEAAVGG